MSQRHRQLMQAAEQARLEAAAAAATAEAAAEAAEAAAEAAEAEAAEAAAEAAAAEADSAEADSAEADSAEADNEAARQAREKADAEHVEAAEERRMQNDAPKFDLSRRQVVALERIAAALEPRRKLTKAEIEFMSYRSPQMPEPREDGPTAEEMRDSHEAARLSQTAKKAQADFKR